MYVKESNNKKNERKGLDFESLFPLRCFKYKTGSNICQSI